MRRTDPGPVEARAQLRPKPRYLLGGWAWPLVLGLWTNPTHWTSSLAQPIGP
ncbi:hypothetical protein U1Q18_046528 [Sarracenia purpurea var. burkii]